MHEYKTLGITVTDAGSTSEIIMTLRVGPDVQTACWAVKTFPMERWGEVRDIIGWASHAFLTAADQLSEDGWNIFHTAECTEAHLAAPDA